MCFHTPSIICKSVLQTPAAPILTITSDAFSIFGFPTLVDPLSSIRKTSEKETFFPEAPSNLFTVNI